MAALPILVVMFASQSLVTCPDFRFRGPDDARELRCISFHPYKGPMGSAAFEVVDLATGTTLTEQTLQAGKLLKKAFWITDDAILIQAQFSWLIKLDGSAPVGPIFGSRFSVSPDRSVIACKPYQTPLYGPRPKSLDYDRVKILFLDGRDPPSLYPLFGDSKGRRIEDGEVRPHILSNLAWSPAEADDEIARLAFVELDDDGSSWVTVLQLELPGLTDVVPSKFQLEGARRPTGPREVWEIEWKSPEVVLVSEQNSGEPVEVAVDR